MAPPTMIDWNDCTPLTRDEFARFIGRAIPFLKDMELKNAWDFFINDMSIMMFCDRFLYHALELNDYELWQRHYPKVMDLLTLWDMILESGWDEEDGALRADHMADIWKLVLNRVNMIADSVL